MPSCRRLAGLCVLVIAFCWVIPATAETPTLDAGTSLPPSVASSISQTAFQSEQEPFVEATDAADDEPDFPLRARFGDGFQLETADRQFQLRIRVLNQVDGKLFVPTDQEPARSGLYIPRFRFYFEGQLTDLFQYELSVQRSVEGVFDVLDANVNFHVSDGFQIRVGRALVPYSFAWYDHLEQYYIAPERGLFPLNFGLARQSQVVAHGRLYDNALQYAIGATFGQLAGLADTNSTRDGLAYVNMRPWLHTETLPLLRFLNIGGSFAAGQQVDPGTPLPLRTSLQTSENDEAAQAASAIFLEFNDTSSAIGNRSQGAVHAAWYVGGVSLETEWYTASFTAKADPAAKSVTVPVSGYDATLGWFITGETIEGRGPVNPLRPFSSPTGFGPGALELFGRYSELDIGNRIFTAGLADPAKWTNRAAITDIGWNWYLNRFVRITFDWQHAMYADPVLLNEAKDLRSRHNDLYWVRCQLYF